ncbi:hypothetical protein [Pararhizobium sp.]|uniref:hypothetical protein n=1 Tax=Pararhizobium sp. TaxID=1977563 RepID=UPI003D14B3C3
MLHRLIVLCAITALLITSVVSVTQARSGLRTATQYADEMENHFRFLQRIEPGGKIPVSIESERIPLAILRVIGEQCGVRMAKINGVIYTFDEDRTVGFATTIKELHAIIESKRLPRCFDVK